uniref:Uncharacterized protein n=1 Tax=Anguilla anguilla TaxID=7936 RepID=A0A0E9UK04_ANGAN
MLAQEFLYLAATSYDAILYSQRRLHVNALIILSARRHKSLYSLTFSLLCLFSFCR